MEADCVWELIAKSFSFPSYSFHLVHVIYLFLNARLQIEGKGVETIMLCDM
jgi:hypothetical protein